MSVNLTLPLLLCALFLTGATAGARGAEVQRPWRVLMVHSFGSSAPPFTTHSTAFESAIAKELGTAVDLDHVSLEMARYAQPDMEEAFAEFLTKRFSRWQPDLVVPIGSPAGRFVAKFRDRLFPQMPVVYTGMDKRTLPADAFARNATFVGEDFDLKGLVEDMLQLVPETNHIVVILGATPLERYWTAQFQEAFKPFEGRVKFTWVNDLSFDQMLDLVSKLPPRSFVLLGLLLRDASGVTYNEDFALARLHAVSRAPINGLFQHEVGLGIVGGRLYQGELEGVEGARVAARILRGEPASSFPPLVIGTSKPTYDWRELRRWGISESRLPPGSVVLFRQPTVWQRYRWHVVGGLGVIVAQGLLILALLFQRRRRNRAELAYKAAQAEIEQKRAELAHVSRVAVFGELTASLAHELNQPLAAVVCNSGAARKFLEAPQPDLRELGNALADIEDDATRAGEVVRRLRDMLKRDTAPRDFADVDLNQVIRSVDRIVHSDAMLHGVTVHLELSGGVLPRIKGDVVELQQVLLNLMINAFGAMNSPGRNGPRRLILRTRLADGPKVLVEVQDSGTGIPPEKLESIFEPFVTSKRDGLGMGLSICRSIIERHGGRIWAANNPDRGATFSITLRSPASEPE
jgi:signal transduction histidine kinase